MQPVLTVLGALLFVFLMGAVGTNGSKRLTFFLLFVATFFFFAAAIVIDAGA